jgi:esterase
MNLNFRQYGEARTGSPPLVLLHGLFGSLINWQRIASNLSSRHHVIVPDLRNHGRSPHSADISYQSMAMDILQLLDDLRLTEAVLIGHSMGGKLAMWLALTASNRVSQLVSVDMAPVTYQSNFSTILHALMALPLAQIESRKAADAWLASAIPAVSIRGFLLQNLQRTDSGWQWRNNLAALNTGIDSILDFPSMPVEKPYTGPAMFIYGSESDYVLAEYHPRILELFPAAGLQSIAGAGHWVYADQPETFLHTLDSRLKSTN